MVSRIQGNSGALDVSSLQGLSAAEQAALVMFSAHTGNPDLNQLAQQLGLISDSFSNSGAKMNPQIASQGRNLDVYTQHTGGPLHVGHKGESVKDLQRQLNAMGANLEVDGKFGPKTEAALRSFQSARGLADNGIAEGTTMAKLGQGGEALTAEQWSKHQPDYDRDAATAAADRGRAYDSRAYNPDLKPNMGVAGLRDQIAEGEGTSDANARRHGYNSGYDVTLGFGAYADDKSKPLSEMTVGEVKALQRDMLRNPRNKWNSSAVGRYQIVGTTLRGLQDKMGFSDNEKFSPEFQDKLADELLRQRGLAKFQSDPQKYGAWFQNNLAQEWASIARADTGRSHYGQGTGTSSREIEEALANVSRA